MPDYLFMLSWSRGVSCPPFLQIFATFLALISVKIINIDSLKRKIGVAGVFLVCFLIGRSVAFIVAELSKADSVREETASRVPGHEKH